MKLIMIAAAGRNREIGWHNDMPWKRGLRKDLAWFRQQTFGSAMVMGRKTFESLPGMLPERKHIIISASAGRETLPAGIELYPSVEAFLEAYSRSSRTIYVIGGASLYRQLMPFADQIILTEIDQDFLADTWFPEIDSTLFERKIVEELQDGAYFCRRVVYNRKPVQNFSLN